MKPEKPFQSPALRWGIFIFALALTVRIANLISLSGNDPNFLLPQVDCLWHHRWAMEIATGSFWGDEIFFRAPLYPYLVGVIYKLLGVHITFIKVIQMFVSAASCVLLYLLARVTFSERVARLASLFIVFYGTLIYYETELLIPVLIIPLDLLFLLLVYKFRDSARFGHWLVVGVVGGLSAIARPNILILFPIYFFWLFLQKYGAARIRSSLPALALTVGVLICVLPVTVRNYLVAEDLVLISSQGGVNLYLGNNQDAEGLTMRMPEIKFDLSIPWSQFVDTTSGYASAQVGRPLKASEVSGYWSGKALEFITTNPIQFFSLCGKKLSYFFSGFENSDNANIYRFKDYSPILATLIFDKGIKFPFGVIAPLALVGLALSWPLRKRLMPIYIFIIGYLPTVILFLVTARHRLPIVVLLMPFAAFAISKLYDYLTGRRILQLVMTATGVVAGLFLLNQKPFDLGFDNASQFYFQRGIAFDKQENLKEAIAAYREAVRHAPRPQAYNNLGYDLATVGDNKGAYQAYQNALRVNPEYADALNNLGLLFLRSNQADSAEHYFKRAHSADQQLVQTYLNLGDLFRMRSDTLGAESYYLMGLGIDSSFVPLYGNLAALYISSGRERGAAQLLGKALRIDPDYVPALVNFGNLLLKQGNYHKAEPKYKRAITLDPTLVSAHLNLGILYLRSGRPDSARVYFRNVLRIDPANQQAQQALRSLEG